MAVGCRVASGVDPGPGGVVMAKKTPGDEKQDKLTPILRGLINLGNSRREEVRDSLIGGLLLRYRPPDATNLNCRLLIHRLGSEPGLVERRTVRASLEKVLPHVPINEPGGVFWNGDHGCYLYTWPPDPTRRQLELFGQVAGLFQGSAA